MQLAATPATQFPWPLPVPGPDVPPRSLSMRLDMPVWDSSLPPEGRQVDRQLEALFRIEGIRESGSFNRETLHRITSGWTKRFDDLEALRGAILALAPRRGFDLTEAVRIGREQLQVLEAANDPGSTREQLELADRAINIAHNGMSALRWGVPADIREGRWIKPGDIARSRVRQFDADGDARIATDEFRHARRVTEAVFGDPRTYEQTFDGSVLFGSADQAGQADGFTTAPELEVALAGLDGNGDGWLTKAEFVEFEQFTDAQLVRQVLVGPRFPG